MAYKRVTLGDLKTRLTERVGNNSTFWVEAEKKDAINEAIKIWQAYTGYWTDEFTFTPGTSNWLDVPTQIVSAQRVQAGSSELPLTSLFELDYGSPGWEGNSGTPSEWSPAGLTLLILKDAPSSGTVTITGIKEAPELEGDGDFIDIGDEELEKLLGYAHHILSFKEGAPELEATKGERDQIVQAAGLRNARFRKSTFYKSYMGKLQDEEQRRMNASEAALGARG